MTEYQSRLRDNTPLTTRRFTPEGFLIANAAATRTGIFDYWTDELGIPGDRRRVKVMRTRETVFHDATLDSLKAAVITVQHPDSRITPETWHQVSVGNVIGEPRALDDSRLGMEIVLRDKAGIKALDEGVEEVSVGYDVKIRDAVDNVGYDYATTGPMKVEHMALVPAGRAGESVRVFDTTQEEGMAVTAEDLKQITEAIRPMLGNQDKAGDIAGQISDALKPVLDSMQEIKDKQAETEREAKAADAQAKAKAAADKLVADTRAEERKRAKVMADALPLIPESKRAALADADTQAILVAAVGDAVPDAGERSEDYLQGVVDQMVKNRQAVGSGFTPRTPGVGTVNDVTDARNEYEKYLTEAYKQTVED